MIVDLSPRLEPGMPSYPGLPVPKFHIFLAHGDSAQHAHYAPGTSFQIAAYELGGNTGTYVDAPFHRHPGGADLADLPLEKLADLAGIVIPAPADGPIEAGVVSSVAVRVRRSYFTLGGLSTGDLLATFARVHFSRQVRASIWSAQARFWSESIAPTSTI
jgi:hypothetical protein